MRMEKKSNDHRAQRTNVDSSQKINFIGRSEARSLRREKESFNSFFDGRSLAHSLTLNFFEQIGVSAARLSSLFIAASEQFDMQSRIESKEPMAKETARERTKKEKERKEKKRAHKKVFFFSFFSLFFSSLRIEFFFFSFFAPADRPKGD